MSKKQDGHPPRKRDTTKESDTKKHEELSEEDLRKISGGLNPQPLPPRQKPKQ